MIKAPTVLQTMLADDLSSVFLKEYARRLPTVYREAESRSIKDDSVDEALKPYIFWQTRYALVQSLFVAVARQSGLQVEVLKCESNGFPILTVTAGRFVFTTHHSSKSDEMAVLNSSLIRQQHASVNHELIQPSLFSRLDDTKLADADSIYSNIIFGCRGNATDWAKNGFLKIAVPFVKKVANKKGDLVDKLFYAELCDYNDVLSLVIERENKAKAARRPDIKVVTPKIKRQDGK
jgi:hypothetical protein